MDLKIQVIDPGQDGEILFEDWVTIDGEPGEDLANAKAAILQMGMEL